MVSDEFWARVKQLAKTNKITQKKMAEIIDVPYKTFQGWLFKRIAPPLIEGFYIARILGVSVEYLLTGRQETPPSHFQIDELRALLKEADERLTRLNGKL
jgi:transcriptional regulator with XRE-family HTH domain